MGPSVVKPEIVLEISFDRIRPTTRTNPDTDEFKRIVSIATQDRGSDLNLAACADL